MKNWYLPIMMLPGIAIILATLSIFKLKILLNNKQKKSKSFDLDF